MIPRSVAEEAFRVLKAGGCIAVWTPCRSHILEVLKNNSIILKRDISHVDYKSMSRMKGILTNAGFEIGRAYFAESHLPGHSRHLSSGSVRGWIPLLRLSELRCWAPSRGGPSDGCPYQAQGGRRVRDAFLAFVRGFSCSRPQCSSPSSIFSDSDARTVVTRSIWGTWRAVPAGDPEAHRGQGAGTAVRWAVAAKRAGRRCWRSGATSGWWTGIEVGRRAST